MPRFRVEIEGHPDIDLVAARVTGSADQIRFEQRLNGQWQLERSFPTASVRRVLQRFLEVDGSVRWAPVARKLIAP